MISSETASRYVTRNGKTANNEEANTAIEFALSDTNFSPSIPLTQLGSYILPVSVLSSMSPSSKKITLLHLHVRIVVVRMVWHIYIEKEENARHEDGGYQCINETPFTVKIEQTTPLEDHYPMLHAFSLPTIIPPEHSSPFTWQHYEFLFYPDQQHVVVNTATNAKFNTRSVLVDIEHTKENHSRCRISTDEIGLKERIEFTDQDEQKKVVEICIEAHGTTKIITFRMLTIAETIQEFHAVDRSSIDIAFTIPQINLSLMGNLKNGSSASASLEELFFIHFSAVRLTTVLTATAIQLTGAVRDLQIENSSSKCYFPIILAIMRDKDTGMNNDKRIPAISGGIIIKRNTGKQAC